MIKWGDITQYGGVIAKTAVYRGYRGTWGQCRCLPREFIEKFYGVHNNELSLAAEGGGVCQLNRGKNRYYQQKRKSLEREPQVKDVFCNMSTGSI